MTKLFRRLGTIGTMAFTMLAGSASATPFWVDWTSVTTTSATGTLGPSTIVLTAVSGLLPAQSALGGSGFWTCGACAATYAGSALSAATGGTGNADLIAIQGQNTYTVTITGPPISNPIYLAFMSLGQPGLTVVNTYTGIGSLVLQAGGAGAFGGGSIVVSPTTVTGTEGNGWVRGLASSGQTISSFSFVTSASEFYQGIQIGAELAQIPEPGTLGLCLGALGILVGLSRRRQGLLRRSAHAS